MIGWTKVDLRLDYHKIWSNFLMNKMLEVPCSILSWYIVKSSQPSPLRFVNVWKQKNLPWEGRKIWYNVFWPFSLP